MLRGHGDMARVANERMSLLCLRFHTVLDSFLHSLQVSWHTLSWVEFWHSILVGLEEMHSVVCSGKKGGKKMMPEPGIEPGTFRSSV